MYKKIFVLLSVCLFAFNASALEQSAEYQACSQRATDDDELALCMKAETARLITDIQQMYVQLVKNQNVKNWNKGDGLNKGNMKDMYDYWLGYRNRYCSLYVVTNANMYGSRNYHRESCLIEMTADHQKLLETLIMSEQGSTEQPWSE